MAFNRTCENYDKFKMRSIPIKKGSKGGYYKYSDKRKELRWCKAMKQWIDDCPDNCKYILS